MTELPNKKPKSKKPFLLKVLVVGIAGGVFALGAYVLGYKGKVSIAQEAYGDCIKNAPQPVIQMAKVDFQGFTYYLLGVGEKDNYSERLIRVSNEGLCSKEKTTNEYGELALPEVIPQELAKELRLQQVEKRIKQVGGLPILQKMYDAVKGPVFIDIDISAALKEKGIKLPSNFKVVDKQPAPPKHMIPKEEHNE